LHLVFDGSESVDPDGYITAYHWTIGNETLPDHTIVDHTFFEAGVYPVTLTVVDNEGDQDTSQVTIEVLDPTSGNTEDSLLTEQKAFLSLINQQRQNHGLSPLAMVKTLTEAATRHSKDMAQHNFISHTGSDGSTPWDRMKEAGYAYYTAAENVAAGQPDVPAVFSAWMNSAGHRANMLNPDFCEMGFGHAVNPESTYTHYWTLTLGCSR
jgi:uncharacterized protein YkwD